MDIYVWTELYPVYGGDPVLLKLDDPEEWVASIGVETWSKKEAIYFFANVEEESATVPSTMTELEHEAMKQTTELWKSLCEIVGDGPSRIGDLRELQSSIHSIQRAIMANSAARSYPDLYRPLGGLLS